MPIGQGPIDSIRITDGDKGYNAELDNSTNTLQTIRYAHHEVHAGSHFFYTDGITLAAAGTQDYLITVPNTIKWPHMFLTLVASLGCIFTFYEATDKGGAVAGTVVNSNRNSTNANTTIIHKGLAGGTTDGNLIATLAVGSASVGGKVGGGARSDEEIVLKQNTKYVLRATSSANANNVTIWLTWYEHVDKR